MQRTYSFDGIKGLAIVSIIFYHLWPTLVPGGFLAVNIFLVLGGYFLAKNFEERPLFSLFSPIQKTFKRLFFPMFGLIVLVLVGVGLLDPLLLKSMRNEVVSSLLLINNFFQIASGRSYFTDMAVTSYLTHLWYISIYVQSYLIGSVLIYFSRKIKFPKIYAFVTWSLFFIVSTYLSSTHFKFNADPSAIYYGLPTRFASFALGIASYYLSVVLDTSAKQGRPIISKGGYFLIAIVSLFCLGGLFFTFSDQEPRAYLLGLPYANLLSGLFILGARRQYIFLERIIGNKVLRWLGRTSFSLYLCYFPLIVISYRLNRLMANRIDLLKGLTFLTIILLSAIFYYLFESDASHFLLSKRNSLKAKYEHLKQVFTPPFQINLDFFLSGIVSLFVALFFVFLFMTQNQRPVALFELEYGIYAADPTPFSPYYSLDQMMQRHVKTIQQMDQTFQTNFARMDQPISTADLAIKSYQADSQLSQIQHLSAEKRQILENIRQNHPIYLERLKPEEILYANDFPVTLFGDSIAEFIGVTINDLFPRANAFGYVSLNIWNAYDEFQALLDQDLVHDNLFINLGTNGGLDVPAVERLIEMAGPRQIYLINSNSEIEFLDQIDEVIQTLDQQYPNVHRVDWRRISQGHPEYFREDDIHPSAEGASYYLMELARTVYQQSQE